MFALHRFDVYVQCVCAGCVFSVPFCVAVVLFCLCFGFMFFLCFRSMFAIHNNTNAKPSIEKSIYRARAVSSFRLHLYRCRG